MTAEQVALRVRSVAPPGLIPLVVFTGGEPLLQLDEELASAVRDVADFDYHESVIAVETNGTALPKDPTPTESGADWLDWICVSPKTPPSRIRQRGGDELKVVYPGSLVDPEAYADELDPFSHYLISPLADIDPDRRGVSIVHRDNVRQAAQYVRSHPRWRLSLQTQKLFELG